MNANVLIIKATGASTRHFSCLSSDQLQTSGWFCWEGEPLKIKSAAEEYWENYVLGISSGIERLGGIRWHLALCLLFAWVIVFLCICKGVKSSGKVVYFTALFPYVMIFVLFIRGITLPGAMDGLQFYLFRPEWSRLAEAKIWDDAAVQLFYSLGPAWGGLITMGSYNKFHNNCHRDSVMLSLVDAGTSLFGGLAIFSLLGYMARELNVRVDDVAAQGPGLAFVVYPEGLTRLPGAPFWSASFFFMLFLLGLDSQFVSIEMITTSLVDEYPTLLRSRKTYVTLATCIVLFLLGLICTTDGGIYIVYILDGYMTRFALLLLALFEIIIIMFIYGHRRFKEDLCVMLGFEPPRFWSVCWIFLTPISLMLLVLFEWISWRPASYGDEYIYPSWAQGFIWFLMWVALVPLPVYAVLTFVKACDGLKGVAAHARAGTLWPVLKSLVKPADDWGPALEENRRLAEMARAMPPGDVEASRRAARRAKGYLNLDNQRASPATGRRGATEKSVRFSFGRVLFETYL